MVLRTLLGVVLAGLVVGLCGSAPARADEAAALAEFQRFTGVKLVFDRKDLPEGNWFDRMVPLPESRQAAAVKVARHELAKYPPRFLAEVGLTTVGIFEACASRQGDGFRPYVEELGGYRYFGLYNGANSVAAAHYSDLQLPLTLHHEIFHHIDAVTTSRADADRRWRQILAGENQFAAPQISPADLQALKKASHGLLLEDAVSEYAAKNPGEDRAETARYLMSALPDSLVQVVERPKLPGSQRLLYVFNGYARANGGKGPDFQWFVDRALGREVPADTPLALSTEQQQLLPTLARLDAYLQKREGADSTQARRMLHSLRQQAAVRVEPRLAKRILQQSANVTRKILHDEIRPHDGGALFVVPGREDETGANVTLRALIVDLGRDAQCLSAIGAATSNDTELITRTLLVNLRLLSQYYTFIAGNWEVTPATRQVFLDSRDQFASAVARHNPQLGDELKRHDFTSLPDVISPAGVYRALDNAYLKNVDEAIEDADLRATIRKVQPACVRFPNGSGVNVSPGGYVLTAAHVVDGLRAKVQVEFPDGRKFTGVCTAYDADLDLAGCTLKTDEQLPYATLAAKAPREDTPVVCIGQPGSRTPAGKPTGYQPFHVSTGQIRGFLPDPLGSQRLGRTKHDAWTYWGHSGSPLFNARGEIVAMHNSWDPETAMRHAITQQALLKFLQQ